MYTSSRHNYGIVVAALLFALPAMGQSAASHVAAGDKEYAALHPAQALSQYQAAIAVSPKNVSALWKASRTAAVLGEFSDSARDTLYLAAKAYGERAVNLASKNSHAEFALAYALQRIALNSGQPDKKFPYVAEIYQHAHSCLKIVPKSAECSYVLGAWNAEAMRLDSTVRNLMMIGVHLGGIFHVNLPGVDELDDSSWENAEKYLLQAVNIDPKKTLYHLDLAGVYLDRQDTTKAKAEYEAALKAPSTEYNDTHYKAAAQKALDALKN